MNKWNKTSSSDTKVKSYYDISNKNLQKRIDMFNSLSCYLSETNDFELCNALRGLIHGSNISNSFTLESIIEETINAYCKDFTATSHVLNKYTMKDSNGKTKEKKSYIDVLVIHNETGIKTYCEVKNGGENGTFDSKFKADDYIQRFKKSGCNKFVILTVGDQSQSYWKTFVELNISNQITHKDCVRIGSKEFLEMFPGFDTDNFASRTKKDGKTKLTSNIKKHISVLESLLNEEVV